MLRVALFTERGRCSECFFRDYKLFILFVFHKEFLNCFAEGRVVEFNCHVENLLSSLKWLSRANPSQHEQSTSDEIPFATAAANLGLALHPPPPSASFRYCSSSLCSCNASSKYRMHQVDLCYIDVLFQQYERPCCIGYTNSSRRRDVVCRIQHDTRIL